MTNQDEKNRYPKSLATALSEALNLADDSAEKIAVKVGMRRQDALLYVALESTNSQLVPQTLLPLLRQILLRLNAKLELGWVKLVKVSGRQPTQSTPLWQEDLLLHEPVPIAQTLMRPVPADIAIAAPLPMSQAVSQKIASPEGGDVSVSVGGNFSGNLIIGDGNQLHNYTYNVAHGGVLNVASQPTVRSRSVPLAVTPKRLPRLLDRQNVLPVLRKSLSQKSLVELYAEPGFGKTALMRHLSYDEDIVGGFSDGVVYLPVGGQPAADLLQSLYDLFYEANPPFKPSYGQAQQALQSKDALVILNGLTLSKAQGEWLITALRDSTFILVSPSPKRIYWQEGEGIALGGLPFPESTALIQIELGRALSDSEKVAAKQLWAAVAGNPLQLRRVAAQVKEKKQSFVIFAQAAQAAPMGDTQFVPPALGREIGSNTGSEAAEQAVFQQIATTLTPKQKKLLALMGAMGGVALSAEQSLAISQVPESAQVLSELSQLHLLQATTGGRYHLSADLLEAVPQTLNSQSWLTQATAYFAQQSAHVAEPGSTEAMMHLLEWTQRTGQWQSSLDLARNLDPALSLNGQWEQWHQVLTTSLQAAERAGDEAAMGWAQHQLGTRALALGHPTEAASLLSQAVRLREQLGDFAGAAVSRHNLGLIVPPLVAGSGVAGPVISRSQPRAPRTLSKAAVVTGIVLGGGIATGLAALQPWNLLSPGPSQPNGVVSFSDDVIEFGVRSLDSFSDPRGVTLTNNSSQPVQLKELSLRDVPQNNSRDFRLSSDSTCQIEVSLAPGESCELLAIFTPSVEGDRTAEMTLSIRADNAPAEIFSSKTITLTGKGGPLPLPSLSFESSQLNFGEVILKQTSQKTTEIINDGDAPLEISAVLLTGRGARRDYTIVSESCTDRALLPEAACSVVLSFAPKATGDRSATLKIESNLDSSRELLMVGVGKNDVAKEEDSQEVEPSEAETSKEDETEEPPEIQATIVAPVANDDSAILTLEGAVSINVLENDTEGVQIVAVTPGQYGETDIRKDGIFYSYIGRVGRDTVGDSFTYTIEDSDGNQAQATVNIQAELPSVPPIEANNDSVTVPFGDSVVIDVLANDSEGSVLGDVGQGRFGPVERDGGQVIYTHISASESSSDSFTYTVSNVFGETDKATVNILVELPPISTIEAIDDVFTVTRGSSLFLNVIANDINEIGGPFQIIRVSPGKNGGETYVDDNGIIYSAVGGDQSDSFTYTIENSVGDTDQATVSISLQDLF